MKHLIYLRGEIKLIKRYRVANSPKKGREGSQRDLKTAIDSHCKNAEKDLIQIS